MKLPKLDFKIGVATIAVTFLGGVAVAATPSSQPPHELHLTSDTSQPAASQTPQSAPSASPTDAQQSSGTHDQASSSASPSIASSTVTAPHAATHDNTTGTTAASTDSTSTTDQTQTQDDPAPPVTAVSATMSDWTDPVPYTPSPFREINTVTGQATVFPATVSYEYCTYTYSDGSTQQVLAGTSYAQAPGSSDTESMTAGNIGAACTLANAPAAN